MALQMKFTIGEKARVGAVLVGSNNKCVAEPTSQPCQEGAPTSSRPSSTSHEVQQMDVVVEGSVGVVKIGRNEHDNVTTDQMMADAVRQALSPELTQSPGCFHFQSSVECDDTSTEHSIDSEPHSHRPVLALSPDKPKSPEQVQEGQFSNSVSYQDNEDSEQEAIPMQAMANSEDPPDTFRQECNGKVYDRTLNS